MQAVEHAASVSVDDYLAGELQCETRHEFIGGLVYAMAGASSEHNIICQNLLIALRSHLRGRPCQVFVESVKLRLRLAEENMVYYPDLIVTCDPRDTERYFKIYPKVLIEVLSPETERVDRREKFSSYTRLESLEEYVLVAQDQMEVTVFRKSTNWQPAVANLPRQQLRLESLDFTLPLSEIYESVLPDC